MTAKRVSRHLFCACGSTKANFGFPGERPLYCGKCKEDGMIDLMCLRCKCGKRPSFGPASASSLGICCKSCKTDDMIRVRSGQCECGKSPSFSLPGTPASHCASCKRDGMIRGRQCPCGKSPSFGHPGGQSICCKACKLPGMVRPRQAKTCPCGSGKIPSVGFPGERASCCRDCKLPGMGCSRKNPMCRCNKAQPWFGFVGGPALCCAKCREPGMVNIKSRKCLCGKTQPWLGYSGQKAICCSRCREPAMVDLVTKRCATCNYTVVKRGRLVCSACDPLRQSATAEATMAAYLENTFPDETIMLKDRVCPEACSKYRPDILYHRGSHIVVVECDEGQHSQYDFGCETRRMVAIAQDNQLPTIFIRLNPDGVDCPEDYHRDLQDAMKDAFFQPPTRGAMIDVVYLFYSDQPHKVRRALDFGGE